MGRAVTLLPGDGDEGFSRSEQQEFARLVRSTDIGQHALGAAFIHKEFLPFPTPAYSAPIGQEVMIIYSNN